MEAETIKNIVIGTSVAAPALIALAVYIGRRLARFGLVFSIIALGIAYTAMSTGETANKAKVPTVTADDGLVVSSASYITNSVGTNVGVRIAWMKTDARLPNSEPLYVSRQDKTGGAWFIRVIHTTIVGAFSAEIMQPDPEEYNYIIWTEWEPPSPIHTNGVWVGQVVEKAKGCEGVDKIVIINGKIQENGKTIAPKKEDE